MEVRPPPPVVKLPTTVPVAAGQEGSLPGASMQRQMEIAQRIAATEQVEKQRRLAEHKQRSHYPTDAPEHSGVIKNPSQQAYGADGRTNPASDLGRLVDDQA